VRFLFEDCQLPRSSFPLTCPSLGRVVPPPRARAAQRWVFFPPLFLSIDDPTHSFLLAVLKGMGFLVRDAFDQLTPGQGGGGYFLGARPALLSPCLAGVARELFLAQNAARPPSPFPAPLLLFAPRFPHVPKTVESFNFPVFFPPARRFSCNSPMSVGMVVRMFYPPLRADSRCSRTTSFFVLLPPSPCVSRFWLYPGLVETERHRDSFSSTLPSRREWEYP